MCNTSVKHVPQHDHFSTWRGLMHFSASLYTSFSDGEPLCCGHYGEGTGPIWLDEVECSNFNSDILMCSHNELGDNNCGHREDAGVICSNGEYKSHLTCLVMLIDLVNSLWLPANQ